MLAPALLQNLEIQEGDLVEVALDTKKYALIIKKLQVSRHNPNGIV